jgi:glutamyl-tRNA reductase
LAWSDSRHLADLVEEQRAAVGGLEEADLLAIGAGERAALVAEQLALEQGLGQAPRS